MNVTGWSLVRFGHVLAAMCWVGGQLLLSLVVLPVLRGHADEAVRGPLIRATAQRFGLLANAVLLPMLLATGVALAWHRGVTFATFNAPGYGRLLGIKLALVVVSVSLGGLYGVIATKRSSRTRPLAIAGLASSVTIVVFATAFVP